MHRLAVLAILALLAGCNKFETEKAIFVANNKSDSSIEVKVDGGQRQQVGAKDSTRFTVEILVPTREVYGYTTPESSVDKVVRVGVSVKNLLTGSLTNTTCDAGAKLITTVTYEVTGYGNEYLRCERSYSY